MKKGLSIMKRLNTTHENIFQYLGGTNSMYLINGIVQFTSSGIVVRFSHANKLNINCVIISLQECSDKYRIEYFNTHKSRSIPVTFYSVFISALKDNFLYVTGLSLSEEKQLNNG
jgi:hypothetical protein